VSKVNFFLLALLGVLLWLLFRKKEDDGFSLGDFKEAPYDKPPAPKDDVGGGGSFGGGGASDSWLTETLPFVPEIKMPPALVIPVDIPVSVARADDYEHSAINETGQTFKKLPFSRFREREEEFI